jgi:diguanylate cyclase (GGDEF)-like protein
VTCPAFGTTRVFVLVGGCVLAAAAAAVVSPPGWVCLIVASTFLLSCERAAANCRHRRALAAALRLAGTDELTGLANRRTLLAALDEALAAPGAVGMLLVDLDGFKAVNDLHGHPAGDSALRVTAARLRQTLPRNCLIARLGGDEFAVLTRDDNDLDTLPDLAGRVRDALARPIAVDPGCQVVLGTSIGTATRNGIAVTATDLLRRADAAMYRAKAAEPVAARSSAGAASADPPGHAYAAAQSLLALNNEVSHSCGYLWPSQIHTTIGHFWLLAQHLTPALTQAGRWLEEQHRSGRVREHASPDPAAAVRAALDALTTAISTNRQTTTALDEARRKTTGLTGHPFNEHI